MKYAIIAAAFFSLSFLPSGEKDVYICVSKSASKYHFDRYCSGLQKCTHTIEKVTKTEAVDRGYTICLLED